MIAEEEEVYEGAITVEAEYVADVLASEKVDTIEEAMVVAEKLGRTYPSAYVRGYREDYLDYDPDEGMSDGLTDEERYSIERCGEQGSKLGRQLRKRGREALDTLNRHRRAIGMGPLPPSAGWSADDIMDEVRRLQAGGILRESNANRSTRTVRALKRRLLS